MDVMDYTRHLEKARIPMLEAANYGEWSDRMESALIMKDFDGVIDFTGEEKGSLIDPEATTQAAKALRIQDKKALAFMKLHVGNNFLPVLKEVTSANEAWHKLKDTNASSSKATEGFMRTADAYMAGQRSCWRCGKTGHVKANCPERKKDQKAAIAKLPNIVF